MNIFANYWTYENSPIRMIDLKTVGLDAKNIKTISMQGGEQVQDISASAK